MLSVTKHNSLFTIYRGLLSKQNGWYKNWIQRRRISSAAGTSNNGKWNKMAQERATTKTGITSLSRTFPRVSKIQRSQLLLWTERFLYLLIKYRLVLRQLSFRCLKTQILWIVLSTRLRQVILPFSASRTTKLTRHRLLSMLNDTAKRIRFEKNFSKNDASSCFFWSLRSWYFVLSLCYFQSLDQVRRNPTAPLNA